ncbi:YXWGXW repeat-containing protein [Chitinimonas viridis]|uniref:YXWGXW repeat-containing protein n=1 Tax=Chitinimonas viridis TaxID=664880 RepID=A0ABT8B0B7_9NEIS|nr:YXWGXW repeat-containing protein [Chitinimonas viridis]MDN3575494.1 YXWGXW repeat-containing protein [Chitinimonas viridis]
MFRKLLWFTAIAASVATALPLASATQVGISINIAPPAPRHATEPRFRHGHVWAPGHWRWNGRHHIWIEGRWLRERPGYSYNQPQWFRRDGRWQFDGGHWSRRDTRRDGHTDRHDRHDGRRPRP